MSCRHPLGESYYHPTATSGPSDTKAQIIRPAARSITRREMNRRLTTRSTSTPAYRPTVSLSLEA